MKDLQKLVKECKAELNAIGIEYGNITYVKINTRATSRWGLCRNLTPSYDWEDSRFEIEISNRLLEDNVKDSATKQTIIHELLHSCKGGMTHKGKWKEYANKVNANYNQYNITRCTSSKELGIDETNTKINAKYILKCSCCGNTYFHSRMSKSVKHPEWFLCGKCHGKLERIK